MMHQLSVVVITFNEEQQIARCLESVRAVADEIVVLDSFSADATVDIARRYHARIFQQAFAGYTAQKNKALEFAKNDFVLCLDADEALDEKLTRSILEIKKDLSCNGYWMNRCTSYCGQFIRHGSWYPDRKLRLFNKQMGKWNGLLIHEEVKFIQPQQTKLLSGDILHFSYNTLEEHIIQNNKFSTLSAEACYQSGKKSNWFKIIVHPCWAFFSGYILKAGFLDGIRGFIIAKNVAHLTFMKYYKLYALYKGIPVNIKS